MLYSVYIRTKVSIGVAYCTLTFLDLIATTGVWIRYPHAVKARSSNRSNWPGLCQAFAKLSVNSPSWAPWAIFVGAEETEGTA